MLQQELWTIDLDYKGYGLENPDKPATLTSYRLDRNADQFMRRVLPAVIVCPGGGYEFVSQREAAPVAQAFNALGCHAFVLDYSIHTMRFPGALLELSRAVAYVREHAGEWNIDPQKIIVCGFSAGGHLAASLGAFWKESYIQRYLGLDRDENRPNGLILGYPVISGRADLVHAGSRDALMGKHPEAEKADLFSLENHVTELVPPVFLWHTSDDTGVPVGNSLVYAEALAAQEIPFEMHIYPRGGHGLSLANELTACFLGQIVPECQTWVRDSVRFFNSL